MPTLLVVEASPLGDHSYSRKISKEILETLKAKTPGLKIVTRDLAAAPLPHLDGATVGAFFGQAPADQAPKLTALSDQLTAEILEADQILIGTPMYNFGVASSLKAWIDHIVRAGKTFAYTAEGPKGLLSGKSALVVMASGGIYSEGPYAAADFVGPYLKAILGFIGVPTEVVRVEGLTLGPDHIQPALAKARAKVAETSFVKG